MKKLFAVTLIMMLMFAALHSCAYGKDDKPLILATTTSLYDTGLLEQLTAAFTKLTGIKVKSLAVGTGEALKMGARGDVDIVMVHSKSAEKRFVGEGFGTGREEIMYNYLLIAGPKDDGAGIKGAGSPEAAFKVIHDRKAPFVSRGDNSGTHMKEMSLWKKAGITPSGSWYIESGSGMADALRIASEKNAYILSDEATFAVLRDRLNLSPYLERNPSLKNVYSIILVNPAKFPKVHYQEAKKFKDFVTGTQGRRLIEHYTHKEGQKLFILFPGKTH